MQKQDPRSDAWDKLLPRVERFALKSWSFGDLPETIVVEELNGTPILGYLGLVLRDGEIDVRLFRTPPKPHAPHPPPFVSSPRTR
jgi:ATP-dependent helicase HrpA